MREIWQFISQGKDPHRRGAGWIRYYPYTAGACRGLWQGRWGWRCGLIAAAVFNISLVLGLLIDSERIAELILWLIVPVLVIWFLFSRFGWQPGYGSDETASI